MKLNILSDLHLGQGELALPSNDADVVVLAGDIARPAEAMAWAQQLGKPVLYVMGNHEFYGGSIPGAAAQLKALCQGTRVQVLDDEVAHIGNVRFLGSTLWTDFELFGDGDGRDAAMAEAVRFMRDYARIRLDDGLQTLLKPQDTVARFRRHAAWLAHALAQPHDGPTVVITHHAPTTASIHPRFEGSMLNACFVSDAGHLLEHGRRATVDPRPHARQLRLPRPWHPRGLQPARLCACRRQRERAFRSRFRGRSELARRRGNAMGPGCILCPEMTMQAHQPLPRALDDTPELELASLAAGGHVPAFEAIMRRHNRLLFRTVRSILKSDADTEDAVQEAYLAAWRALSTFRGDAKLSSWLVRIAMNEAFKRVRQRASNVVMFDSSAHAQDAQPEDHMAADENQGPDLAASRGEMRRLMEARIDELPDVFRTVFVLRAVEEMSVDEVASLLGIPEATVRSRFFRARAQLRGSLSRDMDFALEDAFSFAGTRCDRIVASVLATITPAGTVPPVR